MDIRRWMEDTYRYAQRELVMATSEKALYQLRERVWVKTLARQLESQLDDESIRVFYPRNYDHRSDFGVSQFLYDVHACQVAEMDGGANKGTIHYIQQSLWQIESYLGKERRKAVQNFNKLVVGAGENKLYVGAQSATQSNLLDTILEPAKACSGDIFLVLIPPPAEWDDLDYEINIWQLKKNKWTEIP